MVTPPRGLSKADRVCRGALAGPIPVEQLPMIERIERALLVIAYLIEVDGDVHLPMYEQFEAELAELRRKAGVRERARTRLEAYLGPGSRSDLIERGSNFDFQRLKPKAKRATAGSSK